MRLISVWRFIPLLLSATIALAQQGPAEEEALVKASRVATHEFGTSLKERLTLALDAGGPLLAIDVCKKIAGQIAADMSRKHGLSIRRTALRVRNEGNTPDPFERQALERFLNDIAHGKDPASLEHFEIVSSDSGHAFRYMKAIPTAAAPCLACHGTDIATDVQARLHELYPKDQATGFKAGELRGAFSILVKIR